MKSAGPKKVFIVSDATGETAEKVVSAALLQFPARKVKIRYFLKIRHQDELDRIIKLAHQENAFVAYTLVDTDLRQHILSLAEQLEVARDHEDLALVELAPPHQGQGPLVLGGAEREDHVVDRQVAQHGRQSVRGAQQGSAQRARVDVVVDEPERPQPQGGVGAQGGQGY